MKMEAKKHLFCLPDGSTLKFATYWQTGPINNWYMSHDDDRVWESSIGPKEKHYKVDLWSSRTNLCVLCADFDSLPIGFASFGSFYQYLKVMFNSETAIVARSASRKVKCFFIVEIGNGDMTVSLAKMTLEKIFSFDHDLYSYLDLSSAGVRITYLNFDVIQALSVGLSFLTPICAVDELSLDQMGIACSSSTGKTKALRQYNGDLNILFPAYKFTGAREGLLRILLESKKLLSPEGFGISLLKIANDLNKSHQRVGVAKKYFQKIGWIQKIDDYYIPGIKAKSYWATGKLKDILTTRFGSASSKVVVPLNIPDKAWHESLIKIIGRLYQHYTLEQVLEKIKTIKGAEKGDRLTQATRLYHWYKKNGLKKSNKNLGAL